MGSSWGSNGPPPPPLLAPGPPSPSREDDGSLISNIIRWRIAAPQAKFRRATACGGDRYNNRREEAEVGFEPTNNGFAIRPLGPLGYSAGRARDCSEGFGGGNRRQ